MDFGGHGSANLSHQRSDLSSSPLPTKIPKLDFGIRSNLWPPDDAHNMLSFASSDPAAGITPTNITFSHQDHLYKRGLSLNNGGGGGIRGGFGRMKGPFTPSQWMELEHQALIYKHLVANVPVPSHLLVPLRTSLSSYGSSFPPNFLGWGPFHHLGYGAGAGGSTDPEPGRCRRTDGKKWRCSRDAVPDQKYCERHINRGRHRSRKPVEANTTTAAAAATTTTGSTTASKLAPVTPGTASGGGSTAMPQHFGPSTNNPIISRSRGFQGLSLLPPQMTTTTAGPKLKEAAATFPIRKPNVTPPPFEELSSSEFGLVLSDYSFLNPSERIPCIDNSNSFFQFDDEDNVKESSNNNDQHLVHQFIDDWPKAQSHRQSRPWSEELKSDWTQLSMSIPVAPDFSSSSSSPAQEKSTMAIPRLTHMSLNLGEPKSSWLPVNWGKSMGGPLGEVLISSTTTTGGENSKWKSSPQMGSSPSGVLQKSNLVSLSNSSSASSPEAEKARLTTGFLDSALAN